MDPFTIFALISAASAGVGARAQYVAGKTQEIELKRQAEEEKLAAQSREIERRQQLNRALAANIAAQTQAREQFNGIDVITSMRCFATEHHPSHPQTAGAIHLAQP